MVSKEDASLVAWLVADLAEVKVVQKVFSLDSTKVVCLGVQTVDVSDNKLDFRLVDYWVGEMEFWKVCAKVVCSVALKACVSAAKKVVLLVELVAGVKAAMSVV